jgi:hypothetical protein
MGLAQFHSTLKPGDGYCKLTLPSIPHNCSTRGDALKRAVFLTGEKTSGAPHVK